MNKSFIYTVDVQTADDNRMTDLLADAVCDGLDFYREDIDERNEYNLIATFVSDITPETMRLSVSRFMQKHPELFYIDVCYRRLGNHMGGRMPDLYKAPDRFVIWDDGRVHEYKGHIVYVEE